MKRYALESLKYTSKEPIWTQFIWHAVFLITIGYVLINNPMIESIDRNGEILLLLNKNFIYLSVIVPIYISMTIYWNLYYSTNRKIYEALSSVLSEKEDRGSIDGK